MSVEPRRVLHHSVMMRVRSYLVESSGIRLRVIAGIVLCGALGGAIGAAYLVFLGLTMWRSADRQALGEAAATAGEGARIFRHAFAVTALNPKSITFFIAFVPQFVDPDRALFAQFAVMEVTFVTLASAVVLAYALLAAHLRRYVARPRTLGWLNRGGGAALIGLGAVTALAKRA